MEWLPFYVAVFDYMLQRLRDIVYIDCVKN